MYATSAQSWAPSTHSEAIVNKRKGPEGLKEASRNFMIAAGVFDSLARDQRYAMLGQLSPDISVGTFHMASALMIAQAQACFFEKVPFFLLQFESFWISSARNVSNLRGVFSMSA